MNVDISQLAFVSTAHQLGRKKILFKETGNAMTQFAFGSLSGGETIPSHAHATMTEYFYFLTGSGNYRVGDEMISLHAGVAVEIPAGTLHELSAATDLEFVYFGIAI